MIKVYEKHLEWLKKNAGSKEQIGYYEREIRILQEREHVRLTAICRRKIPKNHVKGA